MPAYSHSHPIPECKLLLIFPNFSSLGIYHYDKGSENY